MPRTSLLDTTDRPTPAAAVRALLTDPETLATPLVLLVIDRYGTEALSWAPETLWAELERDFRVSPPAPVMDRIRAGASLLTDDDFWTNASRFNDLARVLGGDGWDPDNWEPADPWECAWALTESVLLVPPDDANPAPFADEVRAFLGQVLREYGFTTTPDVLGIATGLAGVNPPDDLAADPEFAHATASGQDDKAAGVRDTVRAGLTALADQLAALPLEHGNTAAVLERIRRAAAAGPATEGNV